MTDPEDVGDSTGFHTASDERKQLVAEFDDAFAATQSGHSYSRSRAIVEALDLAIAVEDAIPEEWEMDERGKRTFVRQAILDAVRAEQRNDVSR